VVDGDASGLWRYGFDCDAGFAVGCAEGGWTEGRMVDGRLFECVDELMYG